jgi:pilus assembly protein Flp/PilA
MLRMWTAIQSRFNDEEGASLVEYALLVALIAVVAIVAVTTVGTKVSSNFDNVSSNL